MTTEEMRRMLWHEDMVRKFRLAAECPDKYSDSDALAVAALRTSQAKVYHDHLEQCREIIGGKVASVPDAVLALRDDRALLIAALEEVRDNLDCNHLPDDGSDDSCGGEDCLKCMAREALAKVKR